LRLVATKVKKLRPRRALLTGFVALFPIVLTGIVLYLCWTTIERFGKPLGVLVTNAVSWVTGTPAEELPKGLGTVAALALAVLFVYFLGWFLASVLGRRLMVWADGLLSRLPLVRYIYPHARQLSGFLFGERKLKFNRVVAIEYPRKGIYTIGFVTSDGIENLSRQDGRKMIAVFVPTSPTPFTGWTVLVNENEALPVDMTVDEALRFTVTCGVITPGQPLFDDTHIPALPAASDSQLETEDPS